MRFTSGRLVEVLTKKKVASGVWRCAEIVSDKGDGYMVRYYRCPDIFKEGVDKVLAEAVRPCPPLTDSSDWTVGDVAEVLDDGYWKVSVIEEDLGDDYYQIRVIGSLDEFRVKKSNIRMRQEWKDNKWVLLGKGSENCEDLMMRVQKKARMQQQGDFNNVQPNSKTSSKSSKRSFSDISSTDEGYSECTQKRRSLNQEAKLDAIHDDAYSFTLKADSLVIIKENQGKAKLFTARTSEPNECLSVISSVASCSVNHASTNCSQDADCLCSDAESSNPYGDEEENYAGEWRDSFKTHELDLHNYRCFLEALYASGPLSWEQELVLTNIRMELYVSNDEHLREVKRLNCIKGAPLRCY